MSLGKRVQLLRSQSNRTQRELARSAGLAVPYLSRLEHDHIVPSVRTLLKIAAALNVQVAAFTESKELIEELPIWKQPDTIELAKEVFKYALIAAIMLFVVFRVIKPALDTLLIAQSKTGGFTAAEETEAVREPEVTYSPSASYEQSLQTAREIAKQEPKIVASVVKEWINGNG